jgi:hypothetical protein
MPGSADQARAAARGMPPYAAPAPQLRFQARQDCRLQLRLLPRALPIVSKSLLKHRVYGGRRSAGGCIRRASASPSAKASRTFRLPHVPTRQRAQPVTVVTKSIGPAQLGVALPGTTGRYQSSVRAWLRQATGAAVARLLAPAVVPPCESALDLGHYVAHNYHRGRNIGDRRHSSDG